MITTATATVWKDQHNVIHFVTTSTRQTLADAHENVRAIGQFTNSVPHRVLVDMRSVAIVPDDVQTLYAGPMASSGSIGVALITGSASQMAENMLFVQGYHPRTMIQIFTEAEDAVAWLRSLPDQ